MEVEVIAVALSVFGGMSTLGWFMDRPESARRRQLQLFQPSDDAKSLHDDADDIWGAFLRGRIEIHEAEACIDERVLDIENPWKEQIEPKIWPPQRTRPLPRPKNTPLAITGGHIVQRGHDAEVAEREWGPLHQERHHESNKPRVPHYPVDILNCEACMNGFSRREHGWFSYQDGHTGLVCPWCHHEGKNLVEDKKKSLLRENLLAVSSGQDHVRDRICAALSIPTHYIGQERMVAREPGEFESYSIDQTPGTIQQMYYGGSELWEKLELVERERGRWFLVRHLERRRDKGRTNEGCYLMDVTNLLDDWRYSSHEGRLFADKADAAAKKFRKAGSEIVAQFMKQNEGSATERLHSPFTTGTLDKVWA